MGEIIYEKHFHKETIEELEKERIDLVEAFGEDAKQAPSFNEIMKMIYSNVTYLALPEREKMAQTFIETAIEISNDYELDIEIEEHLSHISATYYFDCGACMGFLRRIIEMSDDISQTVDKVAERQQILLRLFLCKQSSKILEFEHLKAFL